MIGGYLLDALTTLAWIAAAAYGTVVLERIIVVQRGAARGSVLLQPLGALARAWREPQSPARAPDSLLYRTAPYIALASAVLCGWAIPWDEHNRRPDMPITLFLFIVLLAPFVVALANAGWATNGKYALFGAFRAIAHVVAYEVVLGFAILGPAMAAASLSLARIVEAQRGMWYVVWQPVGLVLYLATALIAAYRPPFDTPIAGSELAGGVLAEYAGVRLLIFRAALTTLFVVVSAAGAALYLGGWYGPPGIGEFLPGWAWMLLKTYLIVAALLLIGRHTPRFGHDQMLRFSWKVVLPMSFANLAAVGLLALVVGG